MKFKDLDIPGNWNVYSEHGEFICPDDYEKYTDSVVVGIGSESNDKESIILVITTG